MFNSRFNSGCLLNRITRSIIYSNLKRNNLSYSFSANAKVQRKKHVNIGTIGDYQSGKSTLGKAILQVLTKSNSDCMDFVDLNKSKFDTQQSLTSSMNIEFETDSCHYLLSDNPGQKNFISNLIVGCTQLQTVILVISAIDGLTPICKQHLYICQSLGMIENLIIFVNKIDDNEANFDCEMKEIIELELQEIIEQYPIPITNNTNHSSVPIIYGSALNSLMNRTENIDGSDEQSSILQLIECLDDIHMSNDNDHYTITDDFDFLFPIQIVHNIQGVGIAVIGKVLEGQINTGDSVQIIGGQPFIKNTNVKKSKNANIVPISATAASLKLFDHTIKTGIIGDYLGIALHGTLISAKNVKRGMFVAKNKKNKVLENGWKFKCDLSLLGFSEDHGMGRTLKAIQVGYQPMIHFLTMDVSAIIDDIGVEVEGNQNTKLDQICMRDVSITLSQSAVLFKDLRFIVRDGSIIIGSGIITEVL